MAAPFRQQATVVSTRRITPEESTEEVREIVMEINGDNQTFQPGQSVGVLAPPPEGSSDEHHARLYSIADILPSETEGRTRFALCVRRCNTVDKFTGAVTRGVASNYLCDLQPGDSVAVTGPSGIPFPVPKQKEAKLILIGTGTGIAPFRAFVKHLHKNVPNWKGTIWLFYGAKSGLDLLYLNDPVDNLADYYDKETFEAFQALSEKPNWADPLAWDQAFAERGAELFKMLHDAETYVYVAGLRDMVHGLNGTFSELAGGAGQWLHLKKKLIEEGRWVELVY